MRPIELLAWGAGLGSGLVAARLAIASARRLGDDGFWRRLADVGRLLLSADDQQHFVQQYLRLWPLLFVFVVKKFAIAVIVSVPIVLTWACLTVLAAAIGNSQATGVEMAGHYNVSWPYLSDWEFAFFSAACLTTVLGTFVMKLMA